MNYALHAPFLGGHLVSAANIAANLPHPKQTGRTCTSKKKPSFLAKAKEEGEQITIALKKYVLPLFRPVKRREWVFGGTACVALLASIGSPAWVPSDTATTAAHAQTTTESDAFGLLAMPAPETAMEAQQVRYEEIETGPVKTKQVEMGDLAGENMGNLNTLYTGINGKVSETARVNYLGNLGKMYLGKLKVEGVSQATVKAIPEIIHRYSERRTLTNLSTYVSDIEGRVSGTRDGMDWNGLCATLKVDFNGGTEGCDLLREAAYKITGEHLVAYSFTELMPKRTDGHFNAVLYDHLLRTAGIEYISSIPALGDTYLSLGGWQFTSFAVREDATGAQGASLISRFAAKEHQIPGSVVMLEREDHDRAAYFFSVYNLASLIGCPSVPKGGKWVRSCATTTERANFRKLIASPEGMAQVAQYLAIAHHNPTHARLRTRGWLGKGMSGNLRGHLGPALTIYAQKTHHNLLGLREFLANEKG